MNYIRKNLPTLLGLIALALSQLSNLFDLRKEGQATLSISIFVITVAITLIEINKTSRAKSELEQLNLFTKKLSIEQFQKIAEALEPLDIGTLSGDASVMETQIARSLERISDLAPTLLNKKALRTTIYKLEIRAGAKTKLVHYSQRGENRKARDFVKGDGGRGDHGVKVALSKKTFCVSKMDQDNLPTGVEWSKNYNSFISASIFSGSNVYGLVSVSCSGEMNLNEQDETAIELIAALIAHCFTAGRKAGLPKFR